ncbi:MAG TPA: transcriptional regulator MraZ [Sedimenticola sp.]|nr:transcriptional regulator MraZ [Sedimenticola sp.]
MFRGANNISLDSKGRITIPTRFRECLKSRCASQLVITLDVTSRRKDNASRCLLIYPLPDWEEIERKLAKLPSLDKTVRTLQRAMQGNAMDVEMDGQGRILVPPLLRKRAKLDKRAVLVGQGRKFELWNEKGWDELLDECQDIDLDRPDLPVELRKFQF